MADRRSLVVPLLILAFIFLSPGSNRSPAAQIDARRQLDDVIAEEWRSLNVSLNSSWDPLFGTHGHSINLTGVESDRGYAWDALQSVKGRARDLLQYALGDWGTTALDHPTDEVNPIPIYRNVTGFVRGEWTRSTLLEDVPAPVLNLSQYAPDGPFGQSAQPPRPFDRNITGAQGQVSVRFSERQQIHATDLSGVSAANVTFMSAEMKLTDSTTYQSGDFQLYGVYDMSLGQAVLTTTSDKFAGIFLLPHMMLSPSSFDLSKAVLNDSVPKVIKRQVDGKLINTHPWTPMAVSEDSPFAYPDCDLIVYLQQLAPLTPKEYSWSLLSFLETELRFPTGVSLPVPPELRFAMVAFSPDCGYAVESQGPPGSFAQDGNHLTGPKLEVQYNNSRHHLLMFTFALAAQLFLLMRQMREASTPSTRSRISFYTIATLALGDGFTTMTFLLVSLFVTGLWVNLIGTGFLAFISVSFFGMRFLMDIWAVQAPERIRHAREAAEQGRRTQNAANTTQQRRTSSTLEAGRGDVAINIHADPPEDTAPVSAAQQNSPPSLPAPVTSRFIDTGALPVFMPADQAALEPTGPQRTPGTGADAQAAAAEARVPSFSSLYTRFYLLLLFTLFLSLNAISWTAPARHIFFTCLSLVYLSFWVPQIYRNVQRNCRHALNWEFVIGQSMLRMIPFLYFFGYKRNILFAEVNWRSLTLMAVWVWCQVLVLGSQEIIGPRWFVNESWVPPAYDYHPILREDAEGDLLPVGFSQETSPTAANNNASTPNSPPSIKRRRSSAGTALTSSTPSSPLATRRSSISRESKDRYKRIYDCAICMQELEVPVFPASAGASSTALSASANTASTFPDASLVANAGGLLLARRTYMVTPCRHIFHSSCLEGWMKYRLQCPICRETLPPL